MHQKLGLILLTAILSSCASAPFADSVTARTLGKSNTSFAGGYQSASGVTLQLAHGVGENIDVGLQVEFGSIFTTAGAFVKYAFINPIEDGYAMGLIGAAGTSGQNSTYGALGVAMSYKYRWIEPAFFARYNFVNNQETYDYTLWGKDYVLAAGPFDYFYLNPTVAFWITPKMAIAINAGVIVDTSGDFVDSGSVTPGINYQVAF